MATKVCLDTDVVLDFFKGELKTVQKIRQYSKADLLCLTSLTYFELLTSIRGHSRWDVLKVVDKLEMLDLDRKSSVRASKIYEQVRDAGLNTSMRDILTASICLANNANLFTGKRAPYEGIRGLKFV